MVEESLRWKFAKLLNIVALIGFLWIFSGPWISRRVFTSENALRVDNIDTEFNSGKAGFEIFEKYKTEIEAIPDVKNKTQVLYDYVLNQLSQLNSEVYS